MCELYKQIYSLGFKIPKRDRYGIWSKTENLCLEINHLIIKSALANKNNKLVSLNSARIEIEVLKKFLTITYDLKIIQTKNYLQLESDLQEISRMANGWIKYLAQKEL